MHPHLQSIHFWVDSHLSTEGGGEKLHNAKRKLALKLISFAHAALQIYLVMSQDGGYLLLFIVYFHNAALNII